MSENLLMYTMIKKLYVWRMAEHKTRIKAETKDRMRAEFELSVIAYAHALKARGFDDKLDELQG